MITREAAGTILTHAGPEIGVASTKAFTAQLDRAGAAGLAPGTGTRETLERSSPATDASADSNPRTKWKQFCKREASGFYDDLARQYFRQSDFLYLGRGIHYPMALEGALKLKEISYIHAEGYPSGEMKHGPNALIDENLPVVVLATRDDSDPASLTLLREERIEHQRSEGARRAS